MLCNNGLNNGMGEFLAPNLFLVIRQEQEPFSNASDDLVLYEMAIVFVGILRS